MRIKNATLIWGTALATALLTGGISHAQVSFYGPIPAPITLSNNAASTGGVEDAGGGAVDLAEGIFANKPFTITASVREGYDSNSLTTSNNEIGSFYTNFALGGSYAFGTPRFQLSTTVGGGVTLYNHRPGDKVDLNGSIGLSATYLATPRLTLAFATSTAWMSQPDYSIVGNTNRQNGDYFYTNTSLSANYQWSEKFSTTTSYNLSAVYYADSSLNNEQGNISQTIGQSFNWLLQPKTTVVVEYRVAPTTYYSADLNSFGQYFLIGVDQVFNPRLRFSGRVGAQLNFNNNPVDGQSTYLGPYGETTLSYQFGPASTLSWVSRYGTEASGLDDVTQRVTFRTGLSVTHGFTPRLSGALGANYQNSQYQQENVISTFNENVFDISASLNYSLNRFTSISLGYQFTAVVAPESSGQEYTRHVAFTGLNVSF